MSQHKISVTHCLRLPRHEFFRKSCKINVLRSIKIANISMLKFTGVTEVGKNVQCVQRAKYILSAVPNNTITLSGTDLIPIDIGDNLVTHRTVTVNELGKQLLKAAANGNVDEIKNLLSRGAPFTADWLGTCPLHLAAQNNHLEIAEILLRAGISKDARTKVDRTPLHMAAYEGHLHIVDTLIKHGADIDCKDLLGMTPLHWAVQNGHLDIVEYLIRYGANINTSNKFDLTPIMIARQIGRLDIENSLENGLADCNVAAQNLVIQLATEDSLQNEEGPHSLNGNIEMEENNQEPIIIPLEPTIIEQFREASNDMEEDIIQDDSDCHFEEHIKLEKTSEHLVQDANIDTTNLSDSLKLLQEHGITMLENESDDTNILNSVMENGHSVVLTDVGKEVLNSVKESEQLQQSLPNDKKIVTVTPEEFLAMANDSINRNHRSLNKPVKIRRIVMKKNKLTPMSTVPNVCEGDKQSHGTSGNVSVTDMEMVMNQLIEARKTIEEYKVKLQKKEEEAERYKMQLRLLMDPS